MRHFFIIVGFALAMAVASTLQGEDKPAVPSSTQPAPVDLKKNTLVQKALADQDKAIQQADADYFKKFDALKTERQKKLDAAKIACVAALRRAEAVSDTLKRTDEAVTIKELADTIQSGGNSGWVVLMRSADPSIWNTDTDKGHDSFAISLKNAPQGIQYLMLTGPGGECVIVPMSNQLLGTNGVVGNGRYHWNGDCRYIWTAYHLGVGDKELPRPYGCVDIGGWVDNAIKASTGWGFGNHYGIGKVQGFAWAGKNIGSTVFEISVKTTPLTEAEKKSLKE